MLKAGFIKEDNFAMYIPILSSQVEQEHNPCGSGSNFGDFGPTILTDIFQGFL